jgi:hypothetical protein
MGHICEREIAKVALFLSNITKGAWIRNTGRKEMSTSYFPVLLTFKWPQIQLVQVCCCPKKTLDNFYWIFTKRWIFQLLEPIRNFNSKKKKKNKPQKKSVLHMLRQEQVPTHDTPKSLNILFLFFKSPFHSVWSIGHHCMKHHCVVFLWQFDLDGKVASLTHQRKPSSKALTQHSNPDCPCWQSSSSSLSYTT